MTNVSSHLIKYVSSDIQSQNSTLISLMSLANICFCYFKEAYALSFKKIQKKCSSVQLCSLHKLLINKIIALLSLAIK